LADEVEADAEESEFDFDIELTEDFRGRVRSAKPIRIDVTPPKA